MPKRDRRERQKQSGHFRVSPGVGRQPSAASRQPFSAGLLERHAVVIAIGLVLIASVRIVSTYWVFNHTNDEPAHITAGIEYLDKKTYDYDREHPPLTRIMVGLGPYLAGVRYVVPPGLNIVHDPRKGLETLYSSKHYDRTVALARLGVLPLFWLACAVTFIWAARYFGKPAAVIAVLLFTLLPPVLAHAGLATTDMAPTALAPAGFLMLFFWSEHPTVARSLALGLVVGLGIASKFTMMPFLAATVLAALALRLLVARPAFGEIRAFLRSHTPPFALAAVVCVLVVWAFYRFSFGRPSEVLGFRVPAPEFVWGLKFIWEHNKGGHPAFLLGMASRTGWWYYYLVALAVKTPLPVLMLLGLGIALAIRRGREAAWRLPLAFPLGILLFSLSSHVNIGVRHVLPVYVAFSVLAALAVLWLMELSRTARWAGWALAVLLIWLAAGGAWKHPDYIAYFNELVGNEPEKVLVDSDLDWSQDMKRLGRRLRELGARQVCLVSMPDMFPYLESEHGFPPLVETDPKAPQPGWTAVGPTAWKAVWPNLKHYQGDMGLWFDHERPRERVGSMLLFYVPPRKAVGNEQQPQTPM
jgi:hypothetical protein